MTIAEIRVQIDAYEDANESDHGDRIAALRKIIGEAECLLAGEVAVARVSGWSWGQLAPALGTSRQAVQQRFADEV